MTNMRFVLQKPFVNKRLRFDLSKTSILLALFLGLASKTCPILANRGKVLILLARSAYFALLSRLNARTKQSFVLVLLKQNKHFEKVLTKAKLQLRRKH